MQISKKIMFLSAMTLFLAGLTGSCTQEQQNRISRGIQNWTGTNGVLDVISEGKIMYRFIGIDKLTTARATGEASVQRDYRFGYGTLDTNMNYKKDPDEKKIYFEVSAYSTYVFYENPKK